MSTGSGWEFDTDCLHRALADWKAGNPDAETQSAVGDGLIDLWADPLRAGYEEEDHPGVFQARVATVDVIIVYVPNIDRRSVCVVSIFRTS